MLITTASLRRLRLLVSTAALATLASPAFAATTATWLAPISGNWTDPTKWSTNPQYPNDFTQPGVTYDVLIDSAGNPYTITTTPLMALQSLTLNSPDATILISSDLTVPTITVNAGAFRLNGSIFRNATITAPAGTTPFTVTANSTLSNVVLGAGVAINSSTLTLADMRPFSGGSISLAADASAAVLTVNTAAGAASLSGTGQIVFNGNSSNNLIRSTSGALTLGPDFIIKTGTQGGTFGGGTLPVINQGLVSARTAGKTLSIAGSLTNSGTLEARDGGTLKVSALSGPLGSTSLAGGTLDLSGNYNINQPINVAAGSTLTLRGNWGNSGGLSITGGTLNIATLPAAHGTISPTNGTLGIIGSLTTAQLETIPYTAFPSLAIGIGANLNNTGKTLHLPGGNPTAFSAVSGSATITGGVIDGPAGASLLVSGTPTLNNVTLNVESNVIGNLGFKNELVVNKPMTVSAGLIATNFPPVNPVSATISGTGPIILAGSRFLAGEKVSLTIASGMTVKGVNPFGGHIGGSGGTTTNNGLIIAENSSIDFTGEMINSGVINGVSSGRLTNYSPMTNNGTITIDATSTYTSSSTFTSNLGTIGGAGFFSASAPTTIGGPQNWQPGARINVYSNLLHLNSNAGATATAQRPASANLTLSVAGFNLPRVILGADQDLHSLKVQYWYSPENGLDLNSPTTPGQFRSVRVYDPSTNARSTLYDPIVNSNAPSAAVPTNGIFDSGLSAHPNSRIGLARLIDAHGDAYFFVRPTRIGDVNLDGTVTIADFLILAGNFNKTNAYWGEGDINYDRAVTIADFLELSANFNSSYTGETFPITDADAATLSAFAIAHVPEPTLILPALTSLLLCTRRRRPITRPD